MNERDIFETAIEIHDRRRRDTYLDQACAGDAALRKRLDELLASHDQANSFLNVPVVDQAPPTKQDSPHGTLELTPTPPLPGSETTHHEPNDDRDDDASETTDLSFLQPSSKPGSIGRLGHYEILKVLGQGAFGIVFKAFDEKLHRHVAIKAMNPQLAATSPPRKRFLREARSVAAIKHENIVQVHSVEEQPLPYLAMEFVDGQTLAQKLETVGPLEAPEILHLGRQIAAGLAAAHEKGLIHRDIKPGNILIEAGAEQKVKITDFGLARAADDATMTRTGTIAGTPMYMAPEQAMGQTLDHRADLFSLGSVLYQMTCGRPPFRGPNAIAVLKRVVDETPRPILDILPEAPEWLCAVIEKLHAKNPDERYQTAKEVADLLARCQNELQVTGNVTAVTVPMREDPSSKVRQASSSRAGALMTRQGNVAPGSRRTLIVVVVAAMLLAIAGVTLTEGIGITHFLRPSVGEPGVIANVPLSGDSKTSQGQMTKSTTEGERPASVDFPSWVNQPIPMGQSPFDKLDPAAIPPEERVEGQPRELVAVVGQHARRHWAPVNSVAISPDATFACSNDETSITVWDVATQRPIGRFPVAWGSFSDDSRTLFLHSRARTSHTVDMTKRPLTLASSSAHIPLPGHWREQKRIENGRTLVAWEYGPEGRVVSVDVSGDQPVVRGLLRAKLLTNGNGLPAAMISPNGHVIYAEPEGRLRRAEIQNARFANDRELLLGVETRVPLALRADGQRAVLQMGNRLELWDTQGESPQKLFEINSEIRDVSSLSPDGRWLTSSQSETHLFRVDGAEPKRIGWLDQISEVQYPVAFSSSGDRAIIGNIHGFVRFWDLSGEDPRELSPPSLRQAFHPTHGAYSEPALDPRSGRLMLETYDQVPNSIPRRRHQLWDFADAAPRPLLDVDICLESNSSGRFVPLTNDRWLDLKISHGSSGHDVYTIRDRAWQKVEQPFGTYSLLSGVSSDSNWLFAVVREMPGKQTIEGWDIRAAPNRKWTIPLTGKTEVNPSICKLRSTHGGGLFAVAQGDASSGELTLFHNSGDRADPFCSIPFSLGVTHYYFALSPDGNLLIQNPHSYGGPVVVSAIRDGQLQELAKKELGGYLRWLTFSPDGKQVAYVRDLGGVTHQVGTLDARTLEPLYHSTMPGQVVWVEFAPDGRHLLTLNGNHTVYVLRLPHADAG